MAQTALQNQQQDEQAAAGYDAVIPAQIDTGSTVPPFYQTNHVAAEMAKNPQITPPTTGEIHKQMWVSSMMMGLMTALATGNVAGGLVGGMWAAIGVHDYGYSLRQRSEYIDRLKGDGYSMPAILKWYEDGDSKELDKERTDMLQRDKMTQQDREFNQRLDQQDRQFNQREALQQAEFGQRMAMQGARLAQMEHHQGIMENIALQNAGSARIAAIAKMGSQAGLDAGAGAGGQGSGGVRLQNASFYPSKVQMPSGADSWSPQEKAAYIAAAGQAYHGQMLKDVVTQVSNAKNLRMGLSTPNQLFGKVEDYYKKGMTAPHNQAGDFQANQSVLGIESPTAAPRANQVEATEEHMPSGLYGTAKDWISRKTGYGQSDDARESTNNVLVNSFKQQASGLANEAKNAVQSGGYDLDNPQILAAVVSGLGGHIGGEDLKKLMSGEMSPEQWAEQEANKYATPKDFGDQPTSKPKSNHGSW